MNHQHYNWLNGAVFTLFPAYMDDQNAARLNALAHYRSDKEGISIEQAIKSTTIERRQAQMLSFWLQLSILLFLLVLVFGQGRASGWAFVLVAGLAVVQWLPLLVLFFWRPDFSTLPKNEGRDAE